MSSVAVTAQDLGNRVFGIDDGFYPPVSDILRKHKIPCHPMDRLKELLGEADMVVVGNALNGKSEEASIILESGVEFYSMPSFMEQFLIPGHKTVVCAGTHGKTTTSTMISEYLHGMGANPSFFIGGLPLFFGTNASYRQGGYFVMEGDEYDTAFFDKGPKFLHYEPYISIISSIEFDHADIYSDVESIYGNFRKLCSVTRKRVVLSLDFELNRRLLNEVGGDLFYTYSIVDESADLYLEKLGVEGRFTKFRVHRKGVEPIELLSPFIGEQNLMNLGALISVATIEGIDSDLSGLSRILPSMRGVKRRQEFLGYIEGGAVYSDFAHHPTAVEYTLKGFRELFPERKLNVVFDPATNTNNRKIFEERYGEIFHLADRVLIGKPPKLDRVALEERFSPERLVDMINKTAAGCAVHIADTEGIVDWTVQNSDDASVTVVMSNSGFNGFFEKLKPFLSL